MQLYVTETVCGQLPVVKTSRNPNKLEKKIRIHQKRDLCNSLRIKLCEIGGRNIPFTQQSKLQRQSLDTWTSYTS